MLPHHPEFVKRERDRYNTRSMEIVILAATFWEVRGVISRLGLSKKDSRTYGRKNSKHHLTLRLSGVGQMRARQAAEEVLKSLPGLVISTGFAGALKEEIHSGDLVIDTARSDPKRAGQMAELAEKSFMPAHGGAFFSSGEALLTAREKLKKAQETGAIAVEMESQAIFEVMRAKRIPYLSVRAVSDTLHQNLPPIVLQADSRRVPSVGFFLELLTHPGQWKSFFELVRSSQKASRSLAKILKGFISRV